MFRHPKSWKTWVALGLTGLLALGDAVQLLANDNCVASGNAMVAWPGGNYGYIDLAGRVHIRYCFSGSGYSQDVQNIAQTAINTWNNQTSQTNTEFDGDSTVLTLCSELAKTRAPDTYTVPQQVFMSTDMQQQSWGCSQQYGRGLGV